MWVLAVFGFQILLRVIQKPVPEPALIQFEQVQQQVLNGTAQINEKQEFMSSLLSVLGKSVTAKNRSELSSALSWVAYDLLPDTLRTTFAQEIINLNKERDILRTLDESKYHLARAEFDNQQNQFYSTYCPYFGLAFNPNQPDSEKPFDNLKAHLIPFNIKTEPVSEISLETKNQLHSIMSFYLIHNQSFLTDTKFLGFPFHYFYTAVFLLIFFIFLCWLYCIRIQSLHKKLGIED